MEFRKLTIVDKEQLDTLITIIESTLDQKDFWLPINSISRKHFFDNSWTEFYGLFDNSHLIAAAALFYNEHEFGESLSKLNIDSTAVAEIGRAMVHPQYRGANLLYTINTELVKIARTKRIKYLLATIHPQNIPSQKSFLKLGMEKKHTYTKSNVFVRDIYLMKL